jgi:hypothetical protein
MTPLEDRLRTAVRAKASEVPPSAVPPLRLPPRRPPGRRRGWAAPIAAAIAVATAIATLFAVAGAIHLGQPAQPGPAGPAPAPAVAPHQFSPLIPYAAFGWLPAGNPVVQGIASQTSAEQMAGPNPAKTPWWLVVYAAGQCQLTGARHLSCTGGPFGPLTLTGPAPAVLGHRAFWAQDPGPVAIHPWRVLVWQYARNGWAELNFWPWLKAQDLPWRQDAVKVADHVRYGRHAAPPLAFPARLTGVPASWHVSSVSYRPHGAVLLANQWSLTSGPPSPHARGESQPIFTTELAGSRSSCPSFPHGESAHEVINGHSVIVSRIPTGGLLARQLCAAHANGLRVQISEIGNHPGLGVVSLFAHHLQLLGTNVANWARNPIG